MLWAGGLQKRINYCHCHCHWYNSDVVKVKAHGREICIDRIQICVRVIIVLVAGIDPATAEWWWFSEGLPVLVG